MQALLEPVAREAVVADEFSIDELNDLNNYLAWNIWDTLVMRATRSTLYNLREKIHTTSSRPASRAQAMHWARP